MSDIASQRIDLIGLPLDATVSAESVYELLQKKDALRLVTFINPASWALVKRHPEYLDALQRMTFNLPGSSEVAWACRWINGVRCSRARFSRDALTTTLFKAAMADGVSIMLVGGRPGVDEGAHEKLKTQYPGLKILSTQHGYGEFEPKIAAILSLSPDIVLVDMGAPRQELFLLELSKTAYRGMAITCEGYFEQYIAEDRFYPSWAERWNLHFFWQFYNHPKRAWARQLSDYRFFVVQTAKALGNKYKIGSRR